MKTFTYNGYEGTCETSIEDEVCFGKILFIDDLVLYQSETVRELKQAFQAAVDDYIKTCEELGVEAKKPLKGVFNVRVSPELHKKAALRAIEDDVSLNEVVKNSLECYLSATHDINHNFNITLTKPSERVELLTSSTPRWTTARFGEEKNVH